MAAVFLDIEKAFDRVWQEGLLFKLLHVCVPSQLTKLIRSFLHGRSSQIKVFSHISLSRGIEAGVPQGFCHSPAIYSSYISDIPTHHQTELALFADNTMFFANN